MVQLTSEIRDISSYATYVVRNDTRLVDELSRVSFLVLLLRLAVRQVLLCPTFYIPGVLVDRVKSG